jgi:hypothetical protein
MIKNKVGGTANNNIVLGFCLLLIALEILLGKQKPKIMLILLIVLKRTIFRRGKNL